MVIVFYLKGCDDDDDDDDDRRCSTGVSTILISLLTVDKDLGAAPSSDYSVLASNPQSLSFVPITTLCTLFLATNKI